MGAEKHMKTELLFIVNPVAGHGRSLRIFNRLQAVLDRVASLRSVVWTTQGPGHARELAERAGLEGYERVVAVGGDGTVHEAINGLMGLKPELRQRVAFGVVPAGSGNDFSRNLGVPTDAGALATVLASGVASPVDVGSVNGHYFANVAGVGFDAEVAALANRIPKYVPGTLTYVICALAQLALYKNAAVRLYLDGKLIERRILLVAVGNGAHYGGGMMICPGARMNDGKFRVVVAGDLSRAGVLRTLPQVYSGRHLHNPLVEVYDAQEVRVEAERPLTVQADGEIVATSPTTIQLIPMALRVIGFAAPEVPEPSHLGTPSLAAAGEPAGEDRPPQGLDAGTVGESPVRQDGRLQDGSRRAGTA